MRNTSSNICTVIPKEEVSMRCIGLMYPPLYINDSTKNYFNSDVLKVTTPYSFT